MKKTLALMLLLAGLTVETRAETLIWNGTDENHVWNKQEQNQNWLLGDTPAAYEDGKEVEFNDSASGTIVQLNAELAPASVLVTNSNGHNYTFAGDGKLTGDMQLTKEGAGTLTVNTSNDYTGGTVIANGKVVVGSDNALGNGEVKLAGGTLNLGNCTLSNSVTTQGNASIGNGTLNGNLTVAADKTLTLCGNLGGTGTILVDTCTIRLDNCTLSNSVFVNGWLAIGNGTLNGNVTMDGTSKQLFLRDDIGGAGTITMGENASLWLFTHVLSNDVVLKGSAIIYSGTINGKVSVGAEKKLSLEGDLMGTGNISLGDNAKLNLGGKTLSKSVSLEGNAIIGYGMFNGDLAVGAEKTLALYGYISGTGNITLGDNATLDIGRHTLSNSVSLEGNASIGNGTFNGNLAVGAEKTLTLHHYLDGTGSISLGEKATLNLANQTLSQSVAVGGIAYITGGTFNGNLALAERSLLSLKGNLGGTGTITLGNIASLSPNEYTIENSVTVNGDIAYISNGTYNGDITVGAGKTLCLSGISISGAGTVILGDNATLDLLVATLSNAVALEGSATLSGGYFHGNLAVGEGKRINLLNNCAITGVVTLEENAELNLGGGTYDVSRFSFVGSAGIGGGALNGAVYVGGSKTLSLIGNLSGTGDITLGDNATLDLGGKTLSKSAALAGPASIGNGTIAGSVTVNEGSAAHFFDQTYIKVGTVTAGKTSVKALSDNAPGLLKELSISTGMIAGTGRAASLADGLEIQSESDLLIKSMTITEDNKISVGQHTITLQDVTIKLSQTTYELVDDEYLFDLSDLFHCDVDMAEVTFDASELTLPEGFNPATDSISFNLGDARLTSESATQNINLLIGGHGSQTVSIDAQGRPVFTKLVPTPEPTTGTLGLLSLAALAARRRKLQPASCRSDFDCQGGGAGL